MEFTDEQLNDYFRRLPRDLVAEVEREQAAHCARNRREREAEASEYERVLRAA